MPKLPKPKFARPSRRTLLQVVAFFILIGGAAFYLTKPGADASRNKQAAKSRTVKGKPARKAAVRRRAPRAQKAVQTSVLPAVRTADAPAQVKPKIVRTAVKPGKAKPKVIRAAAKPRTGRPPVAKAAASSQAKKKAKAAPRKPPVVVAKKPSRPPLTPHQAFYSVKAYPIGSRSKRPVKQGEGEIRYRLYCNRWTFRSSVELQPVGKDDGAPESFTIVHREAEDGGRYSVRYTTFEDRKWSVTTARAAFKASGEGEAFAESASERRLIALPKGAIFPVAYMNRLLAAARAGKSDYIAIAYGKTRPFLLLRVVAQIGPAKVRRKTKIPAALGSKEIWRIDYIYTDAAAPDRARPFKASVAINEHGVVLWREMDYGALRLVYTLENVVEAPRSPCREKKKPR